MDLCRNVSVQLNLRSLTSMSFNRLRLRASATFLDSTFDEERAVPRRLASRSIRYQRRSPQKLRQAFLRDGAKKPREPALNLKIGVMGSASGLIRPAYLELARQLGVAIAQQGCILITGACPGLPLAAAHGAHDTGALVVGISPGLSLYEHRTKYRSPVEHHDVLIFTGSGLMGREVVNIRSSDMVAIMGGRSGTLGELAIAYDEGKLIGVLLDTGGISNMVESILAVCRKDTGAEVLYDRNPRRLINRMLRAYRREHYKKPSTFETKRAQV
jgi:uncharacterized protein (TIGR00725 family)